MEMTMYAVVSSGGKQYRVEAGSTLTLERLDGKPGASFTFDRVLLIGDGDEVTVGTPVVPGASVTATVLGESLGPKLVIFKFKQKVKYRRRTGHRQHLTRVRIDAIHPTADRKAAAPAKKAAAPAKKAAAPAGKAAEKPSAKAKAAPRAARPLPAPADPAAVKPKP
ncbi:MAG: 50S ribosomal protein L21, partial [Chloroflexota bacterium]|nr:50S ribosomal protein L21 [Chloroflexota bacterium]